MYEQLTFNNLPLGDFILIDASKVMNTITCIELCKIYLM